MKPILLCAVALLIFAFPSTAEAHRPVVRAALRAPVRTVQFFRERKPVRKVVVAAVRPVGRVLRAPCIGFGGN